jgi:multicomponent Na+:H+ antiporter subunit G
LNENAVIEMIVMVLILVGVVITLFSSLGVIRLPDVYTRAHATTKSATLGVLFILVGAFVYFLFIHNHVSVRLLMGVVFVFLTAPVAGHLIIRSAHRSGVPLSEISVRDELKEDLSKIEQAEQSAQPDKPI